MNDRYEVTGFAYGGMGEVIFVRDIRSTGRESYALKTFADSVLDSEDLNVSFLKEAENMLQLKQSTFSGFDQLISFQGIVEIDRKPYIKMEYCGGGSLRSKLAAGSPGPIEIASIGTQLLFGISFLHTEGVVHRDLKPENILFTSLGDLKITDFGISKIIENKIVESASISADDLDSTSASGTLPYMAPEQLLGVGSVDFRTDLWAFAVILLEAVNGYRPFSGETVGDLVKSILVEAPLGIENIPGGYPKKLKGVLTKCLEKDRSHRYSSFSELTRDWDQIIRLQSSPEKRRFFVKDERISIDDDAINAKWTALFFPDRIADDRTLVGFNTREPRLLRDAQVYYYQLNQSEKAFNSCNHLLGELDDVESPLSRLMRGAFTEPHTLQRKGEHYAVAILGREEMLTGLEVQLKSLVDLVQDEEGKAKFLPYSRAIVDRLLSSKIREERILQLVAQLFFLLGNHIEAENLAREITDANPNNLNAWNTLIYSMKSRGDFDNAILSAQRAAEENWNVEGLADNSILASIAGNLSNWEFAIIFGERVLALNHSDFEAHYIVCASKLNLGDKAGALAHFSAMSDLRPDSPEVLKLAPLFTNVR